MPTTLEPSRSPTFEWKRWPETEAFIDGLITRALEGNALAASLAGRMARETSTRFKDWVDHLVISDGSGVVQTLAGLGFHKRTDTYNVTASVFGHEGGMFPMIAVVPGGAEEVLEVAIKVESVADFSEAHDLGLEIYGYPLGPYRVARLTGTPTSFAAVERRGYLGFDPFSGDMARLGRMVPHAAREAIAAREVWQTRRRRFDDDAEGFDAAEKALERTIELAGSRDLACHLIFEVERDYWTSRNRAARVQKERQDRLGLGWANHDHHTFRSSRRFFPRLIGMFERLGFVLRERYHAGENAGWGAQIVEHPTTGIVIFADLDLAPEEAAHDFAHEALPDLPKPNTVGLWVGLHGESMLGAGMHHLEAQFDFDRLRDDLKAEADIETMKPFSNFPFLRQAFTAGQRWAVSKNRADRLRSLGWIDAEQHAKFLAEGTIGSHLENLQRTEGYKGFNKQAVSTIIAATDPRLH
jgi:hypothetical protein